VVRVLLVAVRLATVARLEAVVVARLAIAFADDWSNGRVWEAVDNFLDIRKHGFRWVLLLVWFGAFKRRLVAFEGPGGSLTI
jgi:hypothetical protein